MPTYSFNSITAAQALSFNPAADTLNDIFFTVKGYSVAFDDPAQRITLTELGSGRAVTFGADVYGSNFGGSSKLIYIGTPGADYVAYRAETNYIFTGAGDDIIVLSGRGPTAGGSGRDTFVVNNPNLFTDISDWEAGDRLYLSSQAITATNYVEGTATSSETHLAYINAQFAAGKNYVLVARDGNVSVYHHADGAPEFTYNVVRLLGRSLDDISPADFLTGTAPANPNAPPPPPPPGAQVSVVTVAGNMDTAHLSSLLGGDIPENTSTRLVIQAATPGLVNGVTVTGSGLTYDANDQITGGVANSVSYSYGDPHTHPQGYFRFTVEGISVSAANFTRWVLTDATQEAFATVLAGANRVFGSNDGDLMRGLGGDDVMAGGGASDLRADSIFGGLGNDVIYAGRLPDDTTPGLRVGSTYLRGDEGDDQIFGGDGFDDINGNMGNDVGRGGLGDDWVVGGKDNDNLSGGDGADLVYGNLGSDTCDGDAGHDIIRGGQDDDIVRGGLGNDFVSGDRGADTMTGGLGADTFHTFGEAGVDRVMDFSLAEGDRVQVDPGTQYTVAQVGADTVITMAGGGQMVLVGVSMSALTQGWIFGA